MTRNGRVSGCYLHGIFTSDEFRRAFLDTFGVDGSINYDALVDDTLDALADHLETYMDLDLLYALSKPVSS